MSERIMFLFSRDEISRINDEVRTDGSHLITVDMHGLSTNKAKRFLKNLVAINKEGYEMCIIHGFNHGTAIKEMVKNEKLSERVIEKSPVKNNPGRTNIKLCAA